MAGEREESWGKKKKFREGQKEQTLDDLSFVFIETVKKLQPKVVVMENVEGLILGEAFSYVQKIYKQFDEIGYRVHHWLIKGELMGIPQTRHRVFFVACRNDIELDPSKFNMSFNYEPVYYADIKEGTGEELNHETEIYKWLIKATPEDKRIGDTVRRCGEPEKLFNHRICWPNNIVQTVAGAGEILRGEEKTRISVEEVLSAQTFPRDYELPIKDFKNTVYICGMSVPPVMMKRIIQRLIEEGAFSYKGVI
jgi:DNA (cytosine-5)-methyltransferase 1